MSVSNNNSRDLSMLLVAATVGSVSFMAFLIFLYAGSFNWIKLNINHAELLVVDTLLSMAFFLQHSIMVRKSFRRRLANYVPDHYHGAVYTIAAGLILFSCMILWQGSEQILLKMPAAIMHSLYFIALLGICWGMWAIRPADMFGLGPIIMKQRARPFVPMPLTIRGPYRWVRHPLYLFVIILFWSCPILTSDRLLFNSLWTIWIVIGTILEERDLVDDFGDPYQTYQKKVPMLFPRSLRPLLPEDSK